MISPQCYSAAACQMTLPLDSCACAADASITGTVEDIAKVRANALKINSKKKGTLQNFEQSMLRGL